VTTGRRLGKVCLIAALPGPDQDEAIRWAESAADESIRRKAVLAAAYLNKCLIEYRAGRPEGALAGANRMAQEKLLGNWQFEAPARLVRSLAQLRLGHRDEARGELEAVRTLERTRIPRPGSSEFGRNWGDWLVMDVLRREAEQALRDDSIKGIVSP
jgi:hypothetical protein